MSKFEIERRYGILWKIADNFDTSLCSYDYDSRARICFDVNCKGKIYNIRIKDEWTINNSKYHLNESYRFVFALYKTMLTLRDNIELSAPTMKGEKSLNYESFAIDISSKKKEVYVYHRGDGYETPMGCCYTTNTQLKK